jgi:hypothetical protein
MTARVQRPRRLLVGVILALAIVIGLVSMFAVWINRQTLNPENGTEVSGKLLEDEDIRNAIAPFVVDQLFSAVDVKAQIQSVLPPEAQALAIPAAAGLRELAERRAPIFLARPKVQELWRIANLNARRQLLRALEEDDSGKVLQSTGGNVVLDLHVLVDRLAADLGLEDQLQAARSKTQGAAGAAARGAVQQRLDVTVPPDAGQLVLMKSDQLDLARTGVSGVRHLALIGTILTFALFALAVWLAVGWRRIALRRVGACLIALGLLVILARHALGGRIVDSLVDAESVKPAADSAWSISTQLLYEIATAILAYGVIVVAAAWLAGPTRAAVAVRHALAPALRDQPGTVYAGVGFAYLLVLLWGPTEATRQPIGIVTIALVLVLGIEVLRRHVAHEFPDALKGEATERMRAQIRAWRHAPTG